MTRLGLGRRGKGLKTGRLSNKAGLSLIEAILSFAVMLLVLLAFLRVLVSTSKANETNYETTQAKEAARQMLEVLSAETFDTLYSRYNSDSSDDPNGVESPGNSFVVEGLDPADNDADGVVGEVVFPTLNGALREDLDMPEFGLPMDLNGDGTIDSSNHASDYALLPIQVRVQWDGSAGPGLIEFTTMISDI